VKTQPPTLLTDLCISLTDGQLIAIKIKAYQCPTCGFPVSIDGAATYNGRVEMVGERFNHLSAVDFFNCPNCDVAITKLLLRC